MHSKVIVTQLQQINRQTSNSRVKTENLYAYTINRGSQDNFKYGTQCICTIFPWVMVAVWELAFLWRNNTKRSSLSRLHIPCGITTTLLSSSDSSTSEVSHFTLTLQHFPSLLVWVQQHLIPFGPISYLKLVQQLSVSWAINCPLFLREIKIHKSFVILKTLSILRLNGLLHYL